VTQEIPVYRFIYPGGDMSVVTNFEYRIPLFGPVIVAGFFDAGVNKLVRPDQLRLNPARVEELNSTYPQANYDGRAIVAEGTEAIRTSTGVELQVMMPVVNAPFRLYWAYNPNIVRRIIQPPVVVDRSSFPNEATFNAAVLAIGQPSPLWERRTMFRFSIGRTF
jgi:outer membrane protein insertion porin family